ncbi:MAG: tRNA (N6-isopentenyl adenosine(37)-C2)-methylthiotransferase MiaB [bacterium]|nr:tRNA (N6-isopentenyl adenosine(37)-C2)-methylthiotransferase MiaB [bacterium]
MNQKSFDEIFNHAPTTEPERQYYFIQQARQVLKERFEERVRSGEAELIYGKEQLQDMLANEVYGTFCITTFGCQMNFRDSEKLTAILEQVGYREAEREEEADFVLYNTCTVRENANQRVYGRLGYLHSLKKKNPNLLIALCGCMMQEKEVVAKIKKSYRFVNLIFGTHNIYELAELLFQTLTEQRMVLDVWEDSQKIVEELPAKRKYAFKSGVNIMFGCNNFCSYCIVPYVRGRERSREPEDIVAEVERLAKDGVVEIMLLGQNVNSYGKNLQTPISFAELLRRVERVEGIARIRFMTSHPKDLSDELIEVMAESKKICTHLHLPMQSGSSEILKKMNRCYTKEQYLALVDRIRAKMPNISLTTDIIVGFPGETEADFEETMDVVRKVRFDSAFTFIYSKRSGTPAAKMENQVPDEVVKARFDRLLEEVQNIAAEVSGREEKTVQTVLVEEIDTQKEGYVTGRLSNNTVVHFPGEASLIGKLVEVYLEESRGFYYMGRQV